MLTMIADFRIAEYRKMIGKLWIVLFFLIVLVGACASLPPVSDHVSPPHMVAPVTVPTDEAKSSAPAPTFMTEKKKDDVLFLQALYQIAGPFNQETSSTARQALESLLSDYPQSKWSDAAQAILRLIGELDTYRQRLPIEQDMVQKLATDRKRTIQENEQVKKELRLLNEKCQAALAELQQENEQLKKDLQLLKNLEMQLDRREKMLR
jgi:hypothetical protein